VLAVSEQLQYHTKNGEAEIRGGNGAHGDSAKECGVAKALPPQAVWM